MPHYETGFPMVCSTADLSCSVWNTNNGFWMGGPRMLDIIPEEAKNATVSLQLRDGRVLVGW